MGLAVNASYEPTEAELKYAVGSVLSVANTPLRLRIRRHLAVWGTRRSRLVTAVVEVDESKPPATRTSVLPLGSEVCVKIFDYDLIGVDEIDDDDWTGSTAEFCSQFFLLETRAYAQLASLGGAEIPLVYQICSIGPYHAIIFEYIDQVNLSQYVVESVEEMQLLQSQGDSALAKVHANGVYHGDIRADNILWDGSTQRFVLLDFDLAIVFGTDQGSHVENWKKMDCSAFYHILRHYVKLAGKSGLK
jgi:serine/threonine protein kinase